MHEERHDLPNWDTKVHCTCGHETTSRAEMWKHQSDVLRIQVAINYAQRNERINELLARVYAAIRKDGGKNAEVSISHPQEELGDFWNVYYRNSGEWKNQFSALTLREALEGWLAEHEHQYDDGPYPR
jgi:hypothetical protein